MKKIKVILTVLAMVLLSGFAANAEVNKMFLTHVYEKYEGSDRYIKVRTMISGCEDMTMEEIDTAYHEYKTAEEKEKTERKANSAKRAAEREASLAASRAKKN